MAATQRGRTATKRTLPAEGGGERHEPNSFPGTSTVLRIGVVDFVSPDEIKVLLDIEAPESVP